MENATKALLIAAAILIAILIISLGLVVYNMASEQVSNADLSEIEMKSFNSKFENYDGTNKTTSEVNALLSTVMSSNAAEKKAGTGHYVTVYNSSDKSKVQLSSAATTITRFSGNSTYTVECVFNGGLIDEIHVTAN